MQLSAAVAVVDVGAMRVGMLLRLMLVRMFVSPVVLQCMAVFFAFMMVVVVLVQMAMPAVGVLVRMLVMLP